MTGLPMTFGANGSALNTPGASQTADQVAEVTKLYGINTPSKGGSPWFSQASFVQPTGVRFTEKMKMEIRCESFSVTNTPQFSRPTTDVSNANYGYITGVDGGGRGMQLGAKISF